MVHRNTYINGPTVLHETWQSRADPIAVFRRADFRRRRLRRVGGVGADRGPQCRGARAGEALRVPPRTTAIGALAFYVSHADPHDYQPTNITFGIMEPPPEHIRDKQKRSSRSRNARWPIWTWNASGRKVARTRMSVRRQSASMKDTLNDFLQHLRQPRCSPHTVTAYENDIATFLKHTSRIGRSRSTS